MKPHPKYKPIGTGWHRVDFVNGKPYYGARSDFSDYADKVAEMTAMIPALEKELGTKVKVDSMVASHGHSNRDGQYTEKYVTHTYLVAEHYEYSREDEMAMFREKYKDVKFNHPQATPMRPRREYALEKRFRKSD